MIARESIEAVRRCLDNLHVDDRACRIAAERLIEVSAWWPDHRSGPVPCPGDAEHIRLGPLGLEVYSGNRFLVERAMRECVAIIREVLDFLDGIDPPENEVRASAKIIRTTLRIKVRGSVANYKGELYAQFGDDKWMKFASHAISVDAFIDEFCKMCELHRIAV